MKFFSCLIILALMAASPAVALAEGEPVLVNPVREELVRTAPARTNATVILCLESGNVVVRGWDRQEVRVRSTDAERLELVSRAEAGQPSSRMEVRVGDEEREAPEPPAIQAPPRTPAPARPAASPRIVAVPRGAQGRPAPRPVPVPFHGHCNSRGSLQLDVPRGATVRLQVQNGDVEVTDVSEARVVSINGDVNLQRVTARVDVTSLNGDVMLNDSSGDVRLNTLSGDIIVSNARGAEPGASFSAKTTSGSIHLEGVTHSKIEAMTVNGRVHFAGHLAAGGGYQFKSMSGDVTLTLPAASSFSVNARVLSGGEIVTDFPVKAVESHASGSSSMGSRLAGVIGAGGPQVTLTTYSGTVHLKKQ